ncbi:MAG: hypothetical protein NZ811_02010 [Gammaproteobacteria bacterium]|nr:hypothetical protein [Gammaproteobacteria bacterium]
MNNTNKEKEDFTKHLEAIAKDITEGIEITKDNIEEYNDDEQYTIGDTVNGWDYIKDCLDIEYTINSDRTYKGARVLVAFGGPNIWINTRTEEIEGYWWGMSAKVPYFNDMMGLDDSLEELYNCQ